MSKILFSQRQIGQSIAYSLPTKGLRALGAKRYLVNLFFSFVYGATLSQIPNSEFKDYDNYLVYAESSLLILANNLQQGIGPALFNEPVWLLINSALGLFFDPDTVVRIIIFVSASLAAWLVLNNNPKYLLLLISILFLPNVIKNYLIHLRQGFAIAIFLWGWYSANNYRRWLWLTLAPFIHSSFFFVISLLVLNKGLLRLRLAFDIRLVVFLIFGLVIALGVDWIATVLGARQANQYEFVRGEISGLGFVLWFCVLLIWVSEGRKFLSRYTFETGVILVYLVTYWFIEITARFFESGLILVLIAGLALTKWRRAAYLFLVLAAGGYVWLANLGKPWLGFGVDAI